MRRVLPYGLTTSSPISNAIDPDNIPSGLVGLPFPAEINTADNSNWQIQFFVERRYPAGESSDNQTVQRSNPALITLWQES